ncbi:MAG: right-handed parallel beta-helix repeat-containing protein [Lewinellaceae bacterium]|nr:right-handed parallel beta-helix repeat-containing protein [Saprospiraceae bacterium]MCB9341255.1 right-handed parallel beta-helix repeat-containing protein [Lewinellaceae bacterium]
MRKSALFLSFSFSISVATASTLHIGQGFPYANFEQAAAVAQPGDTILFHAGTHAGGQFVANLQGSANAWIYIMNAPGEEAILEGGNNAIQFSDPAYLLISGLIFQHQTGNGVNTDDGGSYDSPAHHVIYENCTFRDMSASGNNDLLKLSGLDSFEVRNCTFQNGAVGGSGVDMVGCHHGLFKGNYFENMGSNCIQAKGGTQYIRIEGNFFRNGGQRTLNLGGSTGLSFFRPIDAPFEASDIQVYSNIMVGSWAAIAFVGSVNVEVVNNTIFQPENWVIRILQETVDPNRFVECGDNTFRNNIVYLGNNLSTETNVGPNTRPESFTFSNNLWFNADDLSWAGPSIPVAEADAILNEDPMFSDPLNDDFLIPMNSPAAGTGYPVSEPQFDFYEMGFDSPRSIGAIEANPVSNDFETPSNIAAFDLFPNPGGEHLTTSFILEKPAAVKMELINQRGQRKTLLESTAFASGAFEKSFDVVVPAGWYLVRLWADGAQSVQGWMNVAGRP